MRNYAKFVLIFGILMIAGIILFVVVSGNIGDTISVSDEKMLTLNDIVKDVEENMDSLDSLGEKDYGVDYIVLDSVAFPFDNCLFTLSIRTLVAYPITHINATIITVFGVRNRT